MIQCAREGEPGFRAENAPSHGCATLLYLAGSDQRFNTGGRKGGP
jgi:hypothetical protein